MPEPVDFIGAQILVMVTSSRRGVSFVELEQIPGFAGGEFEWVLTKPDWLLWEGMTREAAEALWFLCCEWKLIQLRPSTRTAYALDGKVIQRLPVVSRVKDREYPTRRWLPVVFDPGPRTFDEFVADNERARAAADQRCCPAA
jgi:hypothetical protein